MVRFKIIVMENQMTDPLYRILLIQNSKNDLCNEFCLACSYNDVIMGAIASQITSLTIAFSTVHLDTDQN